MHGAFGMRMRQAIARQLACRVLQPLRLNHQSQPPASCSFQTPAVAPRVRARSSSPRASLTNSTPAAHTQQATGGALHAGMPECRHAGLGACVRGCEEAQEFESGLHRDLGQLGDGKRSLLLLAHPVRLFVCLVLHRRQCGFFSFSPTNSPKCSAAARRPRKFSKDRDQRPPSQ